LVLSLGGDGTMLASVRAAAPHGVPVLGINLGGVGFLTAAASGETLAALERFRAGDYSIEERLLLEVADQTSPGDRWIGFNDVVVDKGGIARIATFHVSLNGEFVSEYVGDGLIVATPTGSTAYSLSVGGPIVMPTLHVLTLSPISPHSLSQRPIVFSGDDIAAITVRSVSGHADLTVDGQRTRTLAEGATVTVACSPHVGRLVRFADHSFLSVLREKLHWGMGRPPRGDSVRS
jgi:NAD+ kinase